MDQTNAHICLCGPRFPFPDVVLSAAVFIRSLTRPDHTARQTHRKHYLEVLPSREDCPVGCLSLTPLGANRTKMILRHRRHLVARTADMCFDIASLP